MSETQLSREIGDKHGIGGVYGARLRDVPADLRELALVAIWVIMKADAIAKSYQHVSQSEVASLAAEVLREVEAWRPRFEEMQPRWIDSRAQPFSLPDCWESCAHLEALRQARRVCLRAQHSSLAGVQLPALTNEIIQEARGAVGTHDRAPDAPTQYVTLDQAAAIVGKSKKTLERRKNNPGSDMPAPSVEGGGGRANEWEWTSLRPWLEKTYGKKLPEVFPKRLPL
jgi:hypothetical protein